MSEGKPWAWPYTVIKSIGLAAAVFGAAMLVGLALVVLGLLMMRF